MKLPKNIKDEIWEYCRVNDISGVDDFTIKMVKQGFTSEKFGSTPWDKEPEVKEVEKVVEKIVEKIVEKEVPVEIIKEVIVEKEVFITDDEANLKLKDKIDIIEQRNQSLSDKLFDSSKLSGERGREILTLKKEIKNLETELDKVNLELEEEKNKPKQVKEDDIYGENKKGFFGSNIKDIWKKNK